MFMAPSSSVERVGSRTNAAIWFSYWLKKMRSSLLRIACRMESSTGASSQRKFVAAEEVVSDDAGGVSGVVVVVDVTVVEGAASFVSMEGETDGADRRAEANEGLADLRAGGV